ncbi:MAG: serine hydrolase domain-containing protein [Candidatus Thorarchaeota archaeon]
MNLKSREFICILTLGIVLAPVYDYSISTTVVQQHDNDYWPDDSWRVSSLQEQDMNVQRIESLVSRIEDGSGVSSLLIIKNGYLVYENYRQGKNEDSLMHIFSCTKSFTSALIGITIREGYIGSIDDTILPYFSNWTIENIDERKENLTIRHFLTMTTGLDWNEHNISYSSPENMFNRMLASSNPAKFVLDLRMVGEPGLEHVYSTGASQVLSALIREVTGMRPVSFAQEYLIEPLSISDIDWALARVDTNMGGTQLYIRSRDMARFGYLYLRNGSWDNEQIIPVEYVLESKSVAVSTNWALDYGLHWWVNRDYDYFCAKGSQGQGIFIDPSKDLLMIITGVSDSIPMELYFERYVQTAAREGYSDDEVEEPEIPEFDVRIVMFLTIMAAGGLSILVVVIYPNITKKFSKLSYL